MAETVFQNLRTRGTLAVVGVATLASVVITTATITTIGVTTANITTANVQTLSGATIRANQANGVVRARTVSGSAINVGGTGFPTNSIPCVKSTGALGYRTVSATGTLVAGSCT